MSRNVIVGGWLACFSLLLAAGSSGTVVAQDTVLTELYGRGVHAFHRGDYGQAHRLLETAVAEGTTDPRVHYFLGLTSYRLGDAEAAEKSFAVGAKLELDRGTAYPIGKALERIQGPERLLLEDYRDRVRTEQFLSQRARDKARYEARQAAEESILRDRTRPAPATQPPVPVPPSDNTDPFGSAGGPPAVVPEPAAPVRPAPEPAAPVRPSIEQPEEAMAEPALPANPDAVTDPFGVPVDDNSTPPVDDPFSTETAPAMENERVDDPFGAAPPVAEPPMPTEPADTFGDAPPTSPPDTTAPAFGINPENAVENPDREDTRGTVPVPSEMPEPANTESLGEVAPFPATNEPNPYSGDNEAPAADMPVEQPAPAADVPAADDPFGAMPAPAADTPAPADDPFGATPLPSEPADMPAEEPALADDVPAADDPFGAMPAPAADTPAPADDPFGATPLPSDPADMPADEPAPADDVPAADDPFGAMPAPAADTPAPADDPFGATPLPSEPADMPADEPAPADDVPAADDPFGAMPAPAADTPAPTDDPFGEQPIPVEPSDDPFGATPAPADEPAMNEAPAASDPFGTTPEPSAPADDPFGATPADDSADQPAMNADDAVADPFSTETAPAQEDAAAANGSSDRRSNPVTAAFGALSRALIPDVNLPSLPGTSNSGEMPMGGPGSETPPGANQPAGDDPFGAGDDPFGAPNSASPAADSPFGAPGEEMPADSNAAEAPADDPFGPSSQPQDDPFGASPPPQDDPFAPADAPADDPFGN